MEAVSGAKKKGRSWLEEVRGSQAGSCISAIASGNLKDGGVAVDRKRDAVEVGRDGSDAKGR
jgi:hypothetical protein